jgi:hypothetical protein
MPDWSVLYPGRFLKKEALEAPKVIRIVKLTVTELEGEKGVESKVVLSYKSADGAGEMILCKSNAELISHALGTRDHEAWIGHYVTIHNNPTIDLGGKRVGGIRVWGSPELKSPLTVEIKRPRRKKGEIYKLVPTDKKGNAIVAGSEPGPAEDLDAPPPEHWNAIDEENANGR